MIPIVSTDADLAVFPAWRDGMPWFGPGILRGAEIPWIQCHGSFAFREVANASEMDGFDTKGVPCSSPNPVWEVEVDAADGIREDEWAVLPSRLPQGGWMILVIRFFEPESRRWRLLRFFHVAIAGDDRSAPPGDGLRRSLRFRAGHMQESAAATGMPDLRPVVLGEVEWRCGPRRVVAMTFDPETETWESCPDNETGDGDTRYVGMGVVDGTDDLMLSAYFPRVVAAVRGPGLLRRYDVQWSNSYMVRIGSHLSEWHHGMRLFGLNVQTAGIPEPLALVSQSRMLDEPLVVFRFLSTIYATIGHGVLAVPDLSIGEAVPMRHDPAFVLSASSVPNPATGFSGLVLLPDGAYLDGTIATGSPP